MPTVRVRRLFRVIVGLFLLTALAPFFTLHTMETGSKDITSDATVPAGTAAGGADKEIYSTVCLSSTCITETAARLARVYPYKTNHSAWIQYMPSSRKKKKEINNNSTNHQYTHTGIIYVKNFKAASSTAAGIALRIAHRHGNPRNSQPAICRWNHVRAFKYSHRDPQQSLMFTSVRDPSSRAMSRIFYTSITLKGESPSDANLLQKLRWNHAQYGAVSHEGGGYQVRYCSMIKQLPPSWDPQRPNEVVNPRQVEQNVMDLLLAYDFVMVSERMDESVVAFAMLFNLSLSDVLVMNAKQNSNKDAVASASKRDDYLYFSWWDPKNKQSKEVCKLSVPSKRSLAVQAHFQSTEWMAKNYGDYLLQAAANQSLDRTIVETLGRDRFQETLRRYQRLKSKATTRCTNETFSHCSPTGEIQRELSAQNCYADDSGCGYPCIDRMLLAEHGEME